MMKTLASPMKFPKTWGCFYISVWMCFPAPMSSKFGGTLPKIRMHPSEIQFDLCIFMWIGTSYPRIYESRQINVCMCI
jgi:hypothetical protein